MIKGDKKISSKIVLLLGGGDEDKGLAMTALRETHPAVYAALLNYTGYTVLDRTAISDIYTYKEFNIGTKVRYRGMEGCPTMVITEVTMASPRCKSEGTESTNAKYFFKIKAKWYNKSSQSFNQVEDRIECFEIIENEKVVK